MGISKNKVVKEEYAELIVKIDSYDVCMDASFNMNLYMDHLIRGGRSTDVTLNTN